MAKIGRPKKLVGKVEGEARQIADMIAQARPVTIQQVAHAYVEQAGGPKEIAKRIEELYQLVTTDADYKSPSQAKELLKIIVGLVERLTPENPNADIDSLSEEELETEIAALMQDDRNTDSRKRRTVKAPAEGAGPEGDGGSDAV